MFLQKKQLMKEYFIFKVFFYHIIVIQIIISITITQQNYENKNQHEYKN